MPILDDTFPRRLTEIDDLTRPDHSWLNAADKCLFLGEYTARKGFSFSATNQVVLNFKKAMDRRARTEWRYKEQAITGVRQAFGTALNAAWLAAATLVPMPPSKAKADPLYDDRMVRMLRAIPAAHALDIRELLIQRQSMEEAAHNADVRPTPEIIAAGYSIDEALVNPAPRLIGIFDDVLTTGAHYVGARRVLSQRLSISGRDDLGAFHCPPRPGDDRLLRVFRAPRVITIAVYRLPRILSFSKKILLRF